MTELFSVTEIFSTFFDKMTLRHPHREEKLKRLEKFKEMLYNNQEDLSKCYSFF